MSEQTANTEMHDFADSQSAQRARWAKVLAPSKKRKARKPHPMVISGARVRLTCFALDTTLVFGCIAGAIFIFNRF